MDFPTGRVLAESLGYQARDLDRLPAGTLEAFVGAAPLAELVLAESSAGLVVDCGAGGGVDSLLLALNGRPVAALEREPLLVDRLRRSTRLLHADLAAPVMVVRACLPEIPLAAAIAQTVMMNGVANLIQNRNRLLSECFRVLKDGGRFLIADLLALEPLPTELTEDPEAWAWCVGGAGTVADWLCRLEAAGFIGGRVELLETFSPIGRVVIRAARPERGE